MSDTKGRLLFLEHYLMEHTDENHMITTDEMIRIYEEHGFKANRNTIRDDIAVLQASDVDVISERVGNGKGYYICGRQFELAELKTLVDAVTSSRFISKRKSEELIQKIAGLTNEQNREHLMARTFTADRIKPETLGTFITVDTIAAAIEQGKKISFQYIDYLPTKEVVLRHDGKVYVASPYCFLWNDDRYYVLSFSEEKGCVVAFRIDRMRNVAVSEEDAVKDESFNPSEYSRTVLKMFDGNLEDREEMLVAENKLMLNVLDRFGENIETTIVDDQHFRAVVRVRPSATFFSWVFQFSGQIMIAGPADVKQTYELMLDIVRYCQK